MLKVIGQVKILTWSLTIKQRLKTAAVNHIFSKRDFTDSSLRDENYTGVLKDHQVSTVMIRRLLGGTGGQYIGGADRKVEWRAVKGVTFNPSIQRQPKLMPAWA